MTRLRMALVAVVATSVLITTLCWLGIAVPRLSARRIVFSQCVDALCVSSCSRYVGISCCRDETSVRLFGLTLFERRYPPCVRVVDCGSGYPVIEATYVASSSGVQSPSIIFDRDKPVIYTQDYVSLYTHQIGDPFFRPFGTVSRQRPICILPNGTECRMIANHVLIRADELVIDPFSGLSSGRRISLNAREQGPSVVCWSRNAERIAAGYFDRRVLVWDGMRSTFVRELQTSCAASALMFGVDLTWLAVGDDSDEVSVFDTATWQELRRMEVPCSDLCFALSTDGALLAVGGAGRSVMVLDTQTWDTAHTICFPQGEQWVKALCFSPDSKSVWVGNDEGEVVNYLLGGP